MAEEKQQPKEVKAHARYIHVSPRKLRLVADLVRQHPVDQALEQLRFSSKNAAIPLAKAINSAVANAVHNFNMTKENLFIKAITVDGGPVFKTYAPRAQGRAFVERKRTSHITDTWESRWLAKTGFASLLEQDTRIRAFLSVQLKKAGLVRIDIERFSNTVSVTVKTTKPGMIIGKGGTGIEELKKKILKHLGITKLDLKINIEEVKDVNLQANVVV